MKELPFAGIGGGPTCSRRLGLSVLQSGSRSDWSLESHDNIASVSALTKSYLRIVKFLRVVERGWRIVRWTRLSLPIALMIGADLAGPVAALAVAARAFAPLTFVDLLVTLLASERAHCQPPSCFM